MTVNSETKALVVKVDGIDGCGKTTLLAGIESAFHTRKVVLMKEFGNSLDLMARTIGVDRSVSEVLKAIALCSSCDLDDIERELLWCVCSRRTNRIVIPSLLLANDLVLVDRSNLGNLAYGVALDESLGPVYEIATTPIEIADLFIWLDTPVEICNERLKARAPDVIEAKGPLFLQKVRAEYERLSSDRRVHRLDGTLPAHELVDQATVAIKGAAVRSGKQSKFLEASDVDSPPEVNF